jgi:hypothetical protein
MNREELVEQVLRGLLLIVGEYRGSHAEDAGYVDKKTGFKVEYIRATHLVAAAWATVTTVSGKVCVSRTRSIRSYQLRND